MSLPHSDSGTGSHISYPFASDELRGTYSDASSGDTTNPMPSSELRQRILGDTQGSSSPAGDVHAPPDGTTITPPTTTLSVLAVTEQDAIHSDARVVVCPLPPHSRTLEPLPLAGAPAAVARQSPQTTGFELLLSTRNHKCRFFYDVAGDDIIAHNNGNGTLHFQRLEVDAAVAQAGTNGGGMVMKKETLILEPGCWRILDADVNNEEHPGQTLTELVIFRRRFVATKEWAPIAAGSKRPADDEDDGSGTALESKGEKLGLYSNDNPMVDVQLATQLRIDSLDPENSFTISNRRDIFRGPWTAVFNGSHSTHGNAVVKVMKMQDYPNEKHGISKLVQDWKREATFLEKVDHPSIVKFLSADARFFTIFMEYLPYTSLAKMSTTESEWFFEGSRDDARRVLVDMAGALDYLASKGILHNDIKPGNIVYGADRGAMLIDFGSASDVGGKPYFGGTPYYFPPEMIENGSRGIESDVFALGVSMLYLLRKTPLPDQTEKTDDLREEGHWGKMVQEMRKKLEIKGMEGVVRRMLTREVEDRISASGILEELTSA